MSQLLDLFRWNEEYVLSLPTDEFDWIDYKASEKLKDPGWRVEMSKYVSAWANYEDGYMVFGVKDPSPGSVLEIDGGVSENLRQDFANWLDQVIPSLVEPPIQKIASKLISPTTGGSRIRAGHVLVAVHIPGSECAPHQALDHKYYQRLGRRLEPLRHRALLDILGRRKHPDIRSTIIVHIGNAEPILFWRIRNVGKVMAREWKIVIKFPTRVGQTLVKLVDDKVTMNTSEDQRSYWEVRRTRNIGAPLFPDSDVSGTYKIEPVSEFRPPCSESIDYVETTVFADGAPAFKELFKLDDVLRRH
jgi:hypothetical protein